MILAVFTIFLLYPVTITGNSDEPVLHYNHTYCRRYIKYEDFKDDIFIGYVNDYTHHAVCHPIHRWRTRWVARALYPVGAPSDAGFVTPTNYLCEVLPIEYYAPLNQSNSNPSRPLHYPRPHYFVDHQGHLSQPTRPASPQVRHAIPKGGR